MSTSGLYNDLRPAMRAERPNGRRRLCGESQAQRRRLRDEGETFVRPS
jgi:hypothetical protein